VSTGAGVTGAGVGTGVGAATGAGVGAATGAGVGGTANTSLKQKLHDF
jgi:hypothetical protein